MNAARRAVILAAGRGSRLAPRTNETCKALLPLGAGTLIERQLDQLEAAGIRHVTVVHGWLGEQLVEQLGAARGRLQLHYARNADFATTGSAWSLLAAASELRRGEPVLLTHGDLVFDDEILTGVLARGSTAVAADRSWRPVTGDEVVAWSQDGRLAGIRKGAPGEPRDEAGEFVGISLFESDFAARFADFCAARCKERRTDDYEQPLLSDFVRQGEAHGAVSYTDFVFWRNVNYEEDLEDVRAHLAAAAR